MSRDAVTSQLKVSSIDGIIARVRAEEYRDAPFLEDGAAPPAPSSTENGLHRHNNKKKKVDCGHIFMHIV